MAGIHKVSEPKFAATGKDMKAFIPTDYFRHAGYEVPTSEKSVRAVTAQSRTDSLG